MGDIVAYALEDSIATIRMDDGKANALSLDMLTQLGLALDRAASDRAVVVLTGREGTFSGGFDLRTLGAGGATAVSMLKAGFELAERLLAFPMPVVVACNGNAVAMAAFLLLSGDYRIGASGPHKITANEVAIGLTMPHAAVEICRQRLTPSHFNRSVILAEVYSPDDAVTAGFLDQVVPAPELAEAARNTAVRLYRLNMNAHTATKLRTRHQALTAIRRGIEADQAAFPALA